MSPPSPAKLTTTNPLVLSISNYSTASSSRLQSLYSDLSRQRASNPAAFQSNVGWWRRTLEELVQQGKQTESKDTLVLHAKPSLAENLRVERVGKPLGLAAVITELRHNRAIIPLDEFLKSIRPINDPGSLPYRIASYVVGKPLWWALEQMNIVDSSPGIGSESETSLWRKVQEAHVVMHNLENAADEVASYLEKQAGVSLANSLYTFESFAREVCRNGAGLDVTETDVRVLVRYLERDRRLLVTDKDVIKALNPHSLEITHAVTVVDRGILELKTAIASLEAQIEGLQKQISYRTDKIAQYIRAKQQDLAMTHLRARKQHEAQLKKRLGSLDILQDTLVQVENAAQDIEIMKTYESSTATLRTLLSHPSLQRSHVDATLEALAEVNAEQRELDEAIKIGGDVAVGVGESVDEGEIADELEGLLREAKREDEEREERRRLEETRRKIPEGPKGDVGLGLEEDLEKLKLGEGRESANAGLRERTDSKQAVAEPAS